MAAPPPAPALVDDVVEEILLRCPPDDPARLVRAAAACKGWRRLVSDPRFGRRFRELHRTPPLLGFLYCRRAPVLFESTTSFRPPHAFPFSWRAIDARHGRVLLSPFSVAPKKERLIVWCPVTGDLRSLPMPQFEYGHWTAALLCAAPGCGHLDCGCGPFLVVFVGTDNSYQRTSVCVYSSEASAWSEPTSVQHIGTWIDKGPSALVGNALYFLFERPRQILQHNLVTREVSVIEVPAAVASYGCYMVLTTAEEGVLGLAIATGSRLLLWSREAGSDRDEGWVQSRVIELKGLLPPEALVTSPGAVGFADGVGVVIIRTSGGFFFTVDMKSSCVRKIGNGLSHHYVVPYMNFFTPGPRAGASSASQTEGAHVLTSQPRANWTAY